MDILRLVEDLEDVIETGSNIPLTGKVVVMKDEVMGLIEQLRNELPHEITEATRINAEKSLILEDAHREADQILAAAKSQAERLIDEDELVVQANQRAKEIMDQANAQSEQIRQGTRDYADELLERTQVHLSDIIKTLNENRKELMD